VTPKFTIGGGAFYTSRVFGGYADNRAVSGIGAAAVVNPATKVIARTIPQYWRFDARAGYAFSKAVEVSVNVQNLTDKTYFVQANTAHYATIAPGRSAFATLTVKY
jgi:catecholate siderophore receptor